MVAAVADITDNDDACGEWGRCQIYRCCRLLIFLQVVVIAGAADNDDGYR